jgi:methylmalonyl-CoA mutase N-terminal domain/subunit
MDEVGLRDTVDPLAGSYFMETLTKQMEEKILTEMERVEKWGGMVAAVESGQVQRLVSRQAYEWEKDLATGERIKVGVNKYMDQNEGEADEEVLLHEYSKDSAHKKVDSLNRVKSSRSQSQVGNTLKELEKNLKQGKNIMPALVECCLAYATVGEMAGVMRQVLGEMEEPSIF